MTDEQIRTSIETNKLELSKMGKFTHYQLAFYFFFLSAMLFIAVVYIGKDHPALDLLKYMALIAILLIFMGVFWYRLQQRRLKFHSTETRLSFDEIATIVSKIAAELEWKVRVANNKIIVAEGSINWLAGNWGELITILIDDNKIYVNSITNPYKSGGGYSLGRNKKNMTTLIREIENASQ